MIKAVPAGVAGLLGLSGSAPRSSAHISPIWLVKIGVLAGVQSVKLQIAQLQIAKVQTAKSKFL
jgi:hypothetical protein